MLVAEACVDAAVADFADEGDAVGGGGAEAEPVFGFGVCEVGEDFGGKAF